MKNNRVVVCDHIHNDGLEILKNSKDIDLTIAYDEPKDTLKRFTKDADLVITRSSTPVDETFLETAENLKYIIRAGVGVDNVDIDACSKRGIIVMNVPTANTIAAVELTMTHILSALRTFPSAHSELKDKKVWKRENWYGTELYGKKVGVIGFGNIGSRVAIRAKAFEADIIAYDPYIPSSRVTDQGMTYTKNFEDILACDIITIHTPKNRETIGMIGKEEIAKMKEGVIIINVARGGLYDEDALVDGLKSGKIKFAGIDVFSNEPATDHPLLDLDNVNVTPHLGANTRESQVKISTQTAENAIEVIKGISYPNALNMPYKESEIPEFVTPYFDLTQRMSFLAAQVAKGPIESVNIYVEGDIKDYTDSLKTYGIVGAMRESVDENVNYVNAPFIAKERGINVNIESGINSESPYKNKVMVRVTTSDDSFKICGTIFEGTTPKIVNVNGFDIDVTPKGKIIFFKNSDVPGVIGEVGMLLAKEKINIADFRLGRDTDGQAIALIVVDSEVTKDVLTKLSNLEAALDVRYAEI